MTDFKPTVHLSAKELPNIDEYDVGDDYYALYHCKLISKSEYEKGKVEGTFEVLDVKPVPHPKVDKVKSLMKGKK